MKVLFIAPRLPLPADTGGKIRTLNILKQLARFAQVQLITFEFSKEDKMLSQELLSQGIATTLVPYKEMSLFQKVWALFLSKTPVSIAKYGQATMEAAVLEAIKSNVFDAIHIDHLHMAQYLQEKSAIPTFLDEHNVEYLILERCGKVERNWIKKMVYKNQARKMKIYEQKAVDKFKSCFTCSLPDKNLLDALGSPCAEVIPNGVDTQFFRVNPIRPTEDVLVFCGSMDWLPNDDAINYFCENMLALIWENNPKVQLHIIGKNPSPKLTKLASLDPRIVITGLVDDVRSYVYHAKVFIVPLRIGGGTRLKILEAMAMGKAVVSTSIGAEGIRYTENVDIVIADTPADFARKTLDLINQEVLRESLSANGRRLVCEYYDWDIVGKALHTIYKKVRKV